MGPSMATPAEHIHPTSQSTPHSCPEKCYYKWHKSQIEDFVHKKHESWGKKMGKKTSQPLPWPKDPPRLPGFGFFFLTWNKKGGRKEVNCFQQTFTAKWKPALPSILLTEKWHRLALEQVFKEQGTIPQSSVEYPWQSSWKSYVGPNNPCF